MDYNVSFETGAGKKTNKLSSTQIPIEQGTKEKGFASLRRGQQITGMVVSVDKQVTLNFGGQKVTTSKNVLSNAVPGEMKTFEVIKATDNEIELRLLDEKTNGNRQTFTAAMITEKDWDSLLAQREQSAKQAEKEKESKDTKNKLEEINTKLTERDCMNLEENGFSIETMTIKSLYGALNRVKTSVSSEEQKVVSSAIAERLKAENLPVTAENLQKVTKALELSDTAAKIDDKAMRYLISRDAKPTIENIYKAYYSGNAQKQERSMTISPEAWNEIKTQVKEVIGTAGYEISEGNLSEAKWLIENKLPLTAETFTYKKDLEEIKASINKDMVLDKIIEGMKSGTNPKDASLLTEQGVSYEQVIADIHSIREETVTQAVMGDAEITIKKLVTIQESLSDGSKTKEVTSKDIKTVETKIAEPKAVEAKIAEPKAVAYDNDENSEIAAASATDYQYEEIKAHRQLEEIRLKMTLEAAAQLEKKGFSIETQRLEKVVEALRELEDSYYKELLKEADVEATELSLQTLKETTQSIESLKFIPSSVLGSTLSLRNIQTIPALIAEGSKLQAEYSKAGMAYETLMTVPNREYGDSIKKAFANMDSLLSEMNIESTKQNQRAVRILGYNQMEINEKSISQVKAYDQQVTMLMENLHPAITVKMIKEGINPLEIPINELNQTIDRIKEEQGITSEEKYSTYLRKLDKENGLTGEERNAYIGIYRLLYNVEKSDGAALGAVINAEREVTLDNLLTAVQTAKKGRLDAIINDEFGTLQSISRDKETIIEQLSAFGGGDGHNSRQPSEEDTVAEQTEYLNRILKQIKDELSPDKLQETQNKINHTGMPGSQIRAEFAPALSSSSTIWESVKDVPVEKLLEQLRTAEGAQVAEDEVYAGKVQQIRELCKNSEQAIRFLNDYREPSTPQNIMMANHILSNGESPIKKLLKYQRENIVENSENSLKEIDELADTLIDKHSMKEIYEQLDTDAKVALNQVYSEEKIDSRKLAELKSMGQQMTFLKRLAEKEFYQIPIETGSGVTNMNLTILRGTENSGRVSVTIWSEQLGNLKANFSLKEQTLKGFISSDSKRGLEELQKNASEIEKVAEENSLTMKQMDFGILSRENDTYTYQNSENEQQGTSRRTDTEQVLYRLAKAIVQTVRLAEHSWAEKTQVIT
ncbi:MAG: DUF6240 domain-containing protein [Mobilitalea sp.]